MNCARNALELVDRFLREREVHRMRCGGLKITAAPLAVVARARSALTPMWEAWHAGDRARATELVPDQVIDDLIVWGTPERIRDRVERYAANGVTTTAPVVLASGPVVRDTVRALAPRTVTP